jgi:hypothetical protein
VQSEEAARKIAIELAVIADDTRAADVRVLGVSQKVHWAGADSRPLFGFK